MTSRTSGRAIGLSSEARTSTSSSSEPAWSAAIRRVLGHIYLIESLSALISLRDSTSAIRGAYEVQSTRTTNSRIL